jgi:NADH-quinone oxidoreductase subunit F
MRISKRTQRFVAMLAGLPAAAVVVACATLLTTQHLEARRQTRIDKERIERFEQAAREDSSKSGALAAEQKRQTEYSLDLAERRAWLTTMVIVSAIVFLIAIKAFNALGEPRLPRLHAIERDKASGRGSAPGRRKSGGFASRRASNGQKPEQIDIDFVDTAVRENGTDKGALIPILHALQNHYRYLPDAAVRRVCDITDITPAQITGVSSFYSHFRRTPAGRHILRVCHGTACHVAGAEVVTDEIRRQLDISPESDTDPQRLFTIEKVACLGCCTLAPVIQVDQTVYGHLTSDMIAEVLDEVLASESSGLAPSANNRPHVVEAAPAWGELRVGLGSCCVAGGSGKVFDALQRELDVAGASTAIKRVGCVGMCHRTPLVEVVMPGRSPVLYTGVRPEDARAIVRKHVPARGMGRRFGRVASTLLDGLYRNHSAWPITRRPVDYRDPPVAAFLQRQKHIAAEHAGTLDPTELDEYIRHDGFKALEWSLRELDPEGTVDEIRRSGLRGRGGAGFPTGLKWSRVRQAVDKVKYVVCNGDEGDPGAFMDRMIMESYPFRVIEGMAVAAYAIGAKEGYFYIRAEYPLAVKRIRNAIEHCGQRGLLGENIFGTGFSLRLRIMEGAGAFVCGEETALIASIEGRRGMPRLRPPFPADSGLWGKPTLVGNVETYACVPWIMRNGAAEFSKFGTATSKGTKVFALAGKVRRGGLIEVPMGITIREIVEEIGGGIKNGNGFKAVQIGGPSGGCIPAARSDIPVDFEALTRAGAIMGSGGLVVLDEGDCMVDIARYFLTFIQNQSCGKCTYCRIGTRRMLDILDRLCTGRGHHGDLESLEDLARAVGKGSLCGLGKTAPNPVISTLRYFRDEYEAHIEGVCPAGRCKDLVAYRINEKCTGCTICAQCCPTGAIEFTPYERHCVDDQKCVRCDLCRTHCPENAVEVVSPCPA